MASSPGRSSICTPFYLSFVKKTKVVFYTYEDDIKENSIWCQNNFPSEVRHVNKLK